MNKMALAGGVAAALSLLWAGLATAKPTPAQACEKTKNKAAAKYSQCIAAQRGKEIGGSTPDYAACAIKLSNAFTKAETNAVGKGGACPTTDDAAAILARVDGAYNPRNALPMWLSNTPFVDNGDGTVSDTVTGLMWEQKTDLDGVVDPSNPHDADNTYTWSSSGTAPDGTAFAEFLAELNDCEGADGATVSGGFAGHCDWRLPTIAELQGLRCFRPIIGEHCIWDIFQPSQSDYYWSATYGGDSQAVWRVFFEGGIVDTGVKTSSHCVRAVRGGL